MRIVAWQAARVVEASGHLIDGPLLASELLHRGTHPTERPLGQPWQLLTPCRRRWRRMPG